MDPAAQGKAAASTRQEWPLTAESSNATALRGASPTCPHGSRPLCGRPVPPTCPPRRGTPRPAEARQCLVRTGSQSNREEAARPQASGTRLSAASTSGYMFSPRLKYKVTFV